MSIEQLSLLSLCVSAILMAFVFLYGLYFDPGKKESKVLIILIYILAPIIILSLILTFLSNMGLF